MTTGHCWLLRWFMGVNPTISLRPGAFFFRNSFEPGHSGTAYKRKWNKWNEVLSLSLSIASSHSVTETLELEDSPSFFLSLSLSLSLHPHQSLPTCIENYYNAILKVHNEIFAHASDYGTPNGSETWLQEMEILESQELRQYRFRISFPLQTRSELSTWSLKLSQFITSHVLPS